MLESIGATFLAAIEKEIINHAPEIQELVVAQLDKLATLLFDYVQEKLNCAESLKLEETIQEEHQ